VRKREKRKTEGKIEEKVGDIKRGQWRKKGRDRELDWHRTKEREGEEERGRGGEGGRRKRKRRRKEEEEERRKEKEK
jgi:hypothetical protein